MTNLLVRAFIKNSDQIHDKEVRKRYGFVASIVGVVCNVILFLVKFMIGLTIASVSVMADSFNNLSDAASSIISFIGVKMANRPADKEHPFGHGRYEYIAALIVAFLVVQVGFSCFKSAIDKIIHPEDTKFQWLLVFILIGSILLKVWLGFFNRTLGKRINSTVMKATAADAFGDVIITSATVISLIVTKYTGFQIDGYMGVIVSLFVLFAGINIAKDTIEPLIGEAVSPEVCETIMKKVESYEGIVGSHDLIVHSYGPSHTMATIHAEVPCNMDIEVIHEIIDGIERDVLRELDIFLVIHMDPVEVNNQFVDELKEIVLNTLHTLDEKATIHDFRVVNGEETINLIFDLVVPHSYSIQQEQTLLMDLIERVNEKDQRYQCVVTLEHSYVME